MQTETRQGAGRWSGQLAQRGIHAGTSTPEAKLLDGKSWRVWGRLSQRQLLCLQPRVGAIKADTAPLTGHLPTTPRITMSHWDWPLIAGLPNLRPTRLKLSRLWGPNASHETPTAELLREAPASCIPGGLSSQEKQPDGPPETAQDAQGSGVKAVPQRSGQRPPPSRVCGNQESWRD